MKPATQDLIIYQGSTFSKLLKLTVAGAALNITGYTFRMQLREAKSLSSPVLLELTTENGRISINGVLGEVTLTVAAADTTPLNFSSAYYDLEMVNGVVVSRLMEGVVALSKEVTM